ncbi:MAG: hypothetical protein KF893_13110 [Caldilineaceae bacterium]|nr:hypothetical protein [Caldilineaceae bacterium]
MGEIIQVIEKHSGGTCYHTERFSLDHVVLPEYQDAGEVFSKAKVYETHNKSGEKVQLDTHSSVPSLFTYFLDGSRRTYKVADFGSTDGKFLPIIAGQIGTAVCQRRNRRLKKHLILQENVIAIPNRVGDEFDAIAVEIPKIRVPKNRSDNISITKVLKYQADKTDKRFEDLAIAKIQVTMLDMEVNLIGKMVDSNKLTTNQMLMIDGSLQFSNVSDKLSIFQHVIGVSKSFNPNISGLLRGSSNKQIGNYLTSLEFGERTPVFKYEAANNPSRNKSIKIGAWYLRIRPKNKVKRPLDGIIKIEKIATTKSQQEDGFETDMVNEISRSILQERNVTCYGSDTRWTNHLYPIYLTEMFLKSSFVSDSFFLNIF